MIAASGFRTILGAVLAAALGTACANGKGAPAVTHDGLELMSGSKAERAYVKPGEDFKQYTRVGLLDCFVAFKKNWQMNHPNIRTRDMDRIKKALADEFRTVFAEQLRKGGYPVVTEPAENVLLVRPAIIDLNVVAPDTMSPDSGTTFTASAGAMTLYVELYDSVSNEILARAIDRRQASNVGNITWTTQGTNMDAARRLLKRWADLLVAKLDEVHGKPGG